MFKVIFPIKKIKKMHVAGVTKKRCAFSPCNAFFQLPAKSESVV